MSTDAAAAELTESGPDPHLACAPVYEIRVEGHLGSRWAAWFDDLSLTLEPGGVTVLRGPVVDQAALHGLLAKLRDIGIPLVSLTVLAPGEPLDNPLPTTTSGATS